MSRDPLVRWIGAQRDVLRGDIAGRVALTDLASLPHLYALGPLEGVSGEISVFDGEAFIARVVEGRVTVAVNVDARACFLVYASVAGWRGVVVPEPLDDDHALDRALRAAARAHGLAGPPWAFRVRGMSTGIIYHVLDKRDQLPHTPQRHEEAKARFEADRVAIEAIGFYSESHRGVFTPADSDTHVHFRTADGRQSGHVERLRLAPGWVLGLPRDVGSDA